LLALDGVARAAGFLAQTAGWTLVTALVVMPRRSSPATSFHSVALGEAGDVGRQIGAVRRQHGGGDRGRWLAVSGLLPWLSAPGAWQLVAALLGLGAWSWHGDALGRSTTVPAAAGLPGCCRLPMTPGRRPPGVTAAWRGTRAE
jgi:hypothetical protein